MHLAARALTTTVAPATLVGALLYFFGRLHATSFFAYFGVHFTVFDFSTFDYLVRSQDGLFRPISAAGIGVLTVLWSRTVIWPRLPRRIRWVLHRLATPMAVAAGLAGITLAIAGVTVPEAFTDPVVTPGLGLAAGIPLLAHAARGDDDTPGAIEWVAIFVLVSVGLFWAVANYSASLGTSRAQEFERALSQRPAVTLLSDEELDLTGVRATTCTAHAGFRYDGLVLVLQAGDQLLFLPAGWRHDGGSEPAILLPRSDTVHLEFRPAAARRPDLATAC